MIYWVITVQDPDFIGAVYLTTSYKKAIKKLKQFEEKANGRYYYLTSLKLGRSIKQTNLYLEEQDE